MSWHNKKMYINGKCVHPKGGSILLDAKRVIDPFVPVGIKEIERAVTGGSMLPTYNTDRFKKIGHNLAGSGLTEIALRRLEALKPRALELSKIVKRQNIKF